MTTSKPENRFISFYGEHGISPVRQDITDFNRHIQRREKLYRLLGMPTILFSGRRILEVGPGGGYNSLAVFKWGGSIDFVEPNVVAQQELTSLLSQHNIRAEQWSLFSGSIEDYSTSNRYEIILAEGFIPGLSERKEVINALKNLLLPGGIIVVTCIDDLSFLMEFVRRLIGARLIWLNKLTSFSDKLALLCKAFASHLAVLKHSSRPVEDWVADSFLNTTIYANWFGIDECLNEFGDTFSILGSSPHIFTDYSWYKDLEYNSHQAALKQFYAKRHMLIFTDLAETTRKVEENESLTSKAYMLRRAAGEVEHELTDQNVKPLVTLLCEISETCRSIDSRISKALEQGITLLSDPLLNVEKIANATIIAAATGRTQQYLSLVKASKF